MNRYVPRVHHDTPRVPQLTQPYTGLEQCRLASSSQLAWEFFIARRYISGGIARSHARARADTSSREVPCRNLRFFLTRSQEVVRNGSAVGSEVREGYTTAGYSERTDGRTSRRPFRSLKQPVKVSGMRFLRSQI